MEDSGLCVADRKFQGCIIGNVCPHDANYLERLFGGESSVGTDRIDLLPGRFKAVVCPHLPLPVDCGDGAPAALHPSGNLRNGHVSL